VKQETNKYGDAHRMSKTALSILTIVIITTIFFMYKETPAQKTRPKIAKAPAAQPAQAVPDISYTISM